MTIVQRRQKEEILKEKTPRPLTEEQQKVLEASDRETVGVIGALMMQNFRQNLPEIITSSRTLRTMRIPPTNTRALIIGNGPSLEQKKLLDRLSKKGFEGLVFVADTAFKKLVSHGIPASAMCSIDSSDKLAQYISGITDAGGTAILLNVFSHPTTVSAAHSLSGPVYWLIASIDPVAKIFPIDLGIRLLTVSDNMPVGVDVIGTGGNVGTAMIHIASLFTCIKEIGLIGFDMGYPENMKPKETQYYAQLVKKYGVKHISKGFIHHKNEKAKNMCGYTDPVFEIYRMKTLELASLIKQRVVNCSEQGTLFGPNIECMRFEDWLGEK